MGGHDEKKNIVIRVPALLTLAMPSQKTYGKRRKKSILPFFQVYKDEQSTSPQSDKAKERTSATISISAFHGMTNDSSNNDAQLCLDDSIEEMASMLLDDTTMNELQGETGKRLSQTESAKIIPQLQQAVPSSYKALPQLPQLLFNGDDAWALASRNVIVARDTAYKAYKTFSDEEGLDSCPPPVSRELIHSRTSSAPTLPRKSSRRTPQDLEHFGSRDHGEKSRQQPEIRKLTKMTRQIVGPPLQLNRSEDISSISEQPAVNRQIDNMLAASRALKPLDDSLLSESSVASKKSRNTRSGVLSKVRNAINERIHDSRLKRYSQPPKSEELLDSNLSKWSDYEDGPSAVSAMELRLNEGSNLNNPKIQSLMGHCTIRRKPIADDGKSPKSAKSGDDAPSDDQLANVNREIFPSSQSGDDGASIIDRAKQSIQPTPNRSLVIKDIKDEILLPASIRSIEPRYDMDFDALFSSSPLAQSTPRLRLEPSFENDSSKKLKNVLADSHSLFDSDSPKNVHFSEVNVTPEYNRSNKTPSKGKVAKRINSQVKELEPAVRNHLSKRRKKHPSPSKNELEKLEDALKHYSPLVGPVGPNKEEDLAVSFGELGTEGVLQSIDNNMLLRVPAKRCARSSVSGMDKMGQPVPNSPTTEPAKFPLNKFQRASMTPKVAGAATLGRRPEYLIYQLSSQHERSLLAMDELQWDSTTYNVGMKRT